MSEKNEKLDLLAIAFPSVDCLVDFVTSGFGGRLASSAVNQSSGSYNPSPLMALAGNIPENSKQSKQMKLVSPSYL